MAVNQTCEDCPMSYKCEASEDIQQMSIDLRDIKSALLGNEFNNKGLIKRTLDNEVDIKSIKGKMIWISGFSAGIGIIIGAIIDKIFK